MPEPLYASNYSPSNQNIIFTKEEMLSGIITLPLDMPDLKHLISISSQIELIHTSLHTSPSLYYYPTSCCLLLDVVLSETLTYISSHTPSHLHEYVLTESKQITLKLPPILENMHTTELFLNHQLAITPTVHTVYPMLLDSHNIYRRALIALDVKKTQ